MSTIIYDLEIVKAVPDRKMPPMPGVAYCEGWHDHKGMGISVLCAQEFETGRMRVFCEDNLSVFAGLVANADLVVGFNNINFDNRVVLASWGIEVPAAKNYDLLQELWAVSGLGPDFNWRTHGGFGLDAVAKANGFMPKSGNGAQAPMDWQAKRTGTVIDYCSNDVHLTAQLFELSLANGGLRCPKTGRALEFRKPYKL